MFKVVLTCKNEIAQQDQLAFHKISKSMQEISHVYQVWLGALDVEVLPNCIVLHTVDVCLVDLLLVLHLSNDRKILWLL